MRKIEYCFVAVFLLISVLQAQEDIEDMMRKLQEATQEKINQSEQAVQDFIAKDDAEFAKFLEEDWRMFQAFQGMVRDKKPKPVDVPVAQIKKPIVFKGKEVEPIQIPDKPKPKPILVEKTAPGIPTERGKTLNIRFFNVDLEIVYDERFKSPINNNVDNRSISKFWETLSRSDFDNFIKQAKYYKQSMGLNDWGYTLFLHRIGKILYSKSQNEANLFTWFMLSKSGYNVKIGFNDTDVFLLLPTKNMLYSTPYLTLDSQRFFIVSFDETSRDIGNIFTYKGEYPGSNKLLSFDIAASPVFRNEVTNKNLSFKYKNKTYTIPVKFNLDAVNFFEYYPQTNFEVYFNSTMLPLANYSLVKALKPIIEKKTEPEAVNIMLRFVQTAFKYKTDDENFGREKPLFPEETLYYEYSDCEDRSILFAHIVQELLGLEVIGLNYPGHIATAIRFNSNITGDYITYNEKKYLVCDPTYINADIGKCMPQYKFEKPGIIDLE